MSNGYNHETSVESHQNFGYGDWRFEKKTSINVVQSHRYTAGAAGDDDDDDVDDRDS